MSPTSGKNSPIEIFWYPVFRGMLGWSTWSIWSIRSVFQLPIQRRSSRGGTLCKLCLYADWRWYVTDNFMGTLSCCGSSLLANLFLKSNCELCMTIFVSKVHKALGIKVDAVNSSSYLLRGLVKWSINGVEKHGCLTDWLIDWLTDWLINWRTDCLTNWLFGWLTGWLTNWLTDWLTD